MMDNIFKINTEIKEIKLGEVCKQLAEKSIENQLSNFWKNLEVELKENAKEGRFIYKKNIDLKNLKNKKEFLDALSKKCKENGILMNTNKKGRPEPVIIDDRLDKIDSCDEIIFYYGETK